MGRYLKLKAFPGQAGPLPRPLGSSRLVKTVSASVRPDERPQKVRASTAHEACLARALALAARPPALLRTRSRAPGPTPTGVELCACAYVLPRLVVGSRDAATPSPTPRPRMGCPKLGPGVARGPIPPCAVLSLFILCTFCSVSAYSVPAMGAVYC